MSSERKYTGMAKLFAIEEKQQKEKAAERASANILPTEKSAPAENIAAPAISAPPANISAPAKVPPQPLQFSGAEISAPPAIFAHPEQHTRIPNEVFEEVLPTLKTSEQSILLRLYRLSWGFQKDMCHVSMGKLAKYCNLSPRQVTTCIQTLEKRRFIERLHVDLNNKNQQERGVTFKMLLPQAARAKIAAPANISPGAEIAAGAEIADNKRKALKENIKGGNELTLDTKACPDCNGTGYWYPEGTEKGVAKCAHRKLRGT
jgi:DNA-binding Lrp family transcriptional regulator